MKILVNAIPLSGLTTGISRCLRNLYTEMAQLPGVEIYYFTGTKVLSQMPPPAEPGRWIKNTSVVWKLPDLLVFALRSLHWLKYEYLLRRCVRENSFDLYHETAFFPARLTTIPCIYTIYDLSLIHYRDKHPRERVWFNDFFFPRRISYADHVLTISDFIKKEICDYMNLRQGKVSVVPLAADPVFKKQSPDEVIRNLAGLNLPEKYFLFVGSLEPRKNLELIIRAMASQKNPIPLVLAGWDGWGDKSWLKEALPQELKEKIILPGYVDDKTLACLYTGAVGFIYPSLYEGFGLPVLEAMACGCPVICSNAASLPEVAGDAALYIDPSDPDALQLAMDQIISNPDLRQDLRERGLVQASRFSWKNTAEITLRVFHDHC
jgi:alpha-1,3-rhamnosyl/mannosyltransferase